MLNIFEFSEDLFFNRFYKQLFLTILFIDKYEKQHNNPCSKLTGCKSLLLRTVLLNHNSKIFFSTRVSVPFFLEFHLVCFFNFWVSISSSFCYAAIGVCKLNFYSRVILISVFITALFTLIFRFKMNLTSNNKKKISNRISSVFATSFISINAFYLEMYRILQQDSISIFFVVFNSVCCSYLKVNRRKLTRARFQCILRLHGNHTSKPFSMTYTNLLKRAKNIVNGNLQSNAKRFAM